MSGSWFLQSDGVHATLNREGVQVLIYTHDGSQIYGEVFKAADEEGCISFWPWGVREPIRVRLADVKHAIAANVATHREFAAIRARQRETFEGKGRR